MNIDRQRESSHDRLSRDAAFKPFVNLPLLLFAPASPLQMTGVDINSFFCNDGTNSCKGDAV